MDRHLPPTGRWRTWHTRRAGHWALWLLLGALLLALLARQARPSLPLAASAQMAPVRRGEFRDELLLRARAEPLRSVQLDAQDSGRVEALLVRDGDWVRAGQPVLRLHSREQDQLLMQRAAEVAQQLANVSVQRAALATSQAQSRRELTQMQHEEQRLQLQWQRQQALAAEGFVAPAALQEAERQHRLAAQLARQAQADQTLEAQTRQQSLAEMDRAVSGLQQGLDLLRRAQAQLQVTAPLSGQLSGLALQVGASVRAGQQLARIDDPASGTQLLADVDEFYLPRLQAGQTALSAQGLLRLVQVLPQVSGGKARLLLRWVADTAPAGLRPGQNLDLRLQLSAPRKALLLPDGPGVQTTLYVRQGDQLARRSVHLGGRAGGTVEVLAGLQVGDEVLVSSTPHTDPFLRLP
jgi:HlyD family secretion protein